MADIGGINVNINVNIAETITGLKAIQREAKKATQDLRELESTFNYVSTQVRPSGEVIGESLRGIMGVLAVSE